MSWIKTKIGSFLKERTDRFSPQEANKKGLKRLDKIDFSGKIHLKEKPTNTNMILIKKGDLIISGINVEKGAIAVYSGDEDILATIHYSSYEYDKEKIEIDFLKWFLKSANFKELINSKIKNGIKTEIKPKLFLTLEVYLPDKKIQKEILQKINAVNYEINEIIDIHKRNIKYVNKLSQSILQEAVQGKLVPQDPKDEPAVELLKKIKIEKEKLIKEKKIKKDKLLPLIEEEEIPFKLPKGWMWIRLGEIITTTSGGTPLRTMATYWGGNIPWLKSGELSDNLNILKSEEFITEDGLKNSSAKLFKKGTVVMALYGATAGKLGILGFDTTTNQAVCNFLENSFVDSKYLFYFLKSQRSKIISECFGAAQPNISQDYVKNIPFPLLSLSEQKRIVEKIDKLMALCDELEIKVKENQKNSELLMEVILKEAFELKS